MDSFGVVRYKDTVLLTEKILKQPDLQPWGSSSQLGSGGWAAASHPQPPLRVLSGGPAASAGLEEVSLGLSKKHKDPSCKAKICCHRLGQLTK